MIPAYRFWGKLDPSVDPPRMHPLVDHCIDVASVFRRIVDVAAFLRRLEVTSGHLLSGGQLDRLAVIALLHDIGKCNRGFQAKRDSDAGETAGHVVEAGAFLVAEQLQDLWSPTWRRFIEELCSWFRGGSEHALAVLLAAISHHGRPVSLDLINHGTPARWWRPEREIDPLRGVDELVDAARRAFPGAFDAAVEPIDATPALQHRFAGLVMLADWIGSDTQFFPYRADDTEDRVEFADLAARRAVLAIGLQTPTGRAATSFADTFGFAPSPLQQLLAFDLPVDEDSRLVLVESDTGSGKTEAAIAWFLRLYAAGEVDGLYFALPTRVAARELYGRVCRSVEHAFPEPASRPGPVLLAASGYVRVDGERRALPHPEGRLWDDDVEARRRERQWAAEHPKRFLAAPVAVGTVDQALLSVLQVKHALLRSVCLDRSLLVVDEVHASDPYMRQTLRSLLDSHLGRGGRAMLLSATLGESARGTLFASDVRTLSEAQARPYPSVTTRQGERPVASHGNVKRVRAELLDGFDDETVLPLVREALDAGARVLVVCNTVKRANELLRAVEACSLVSPSVLFTVGGHVCPHHGRFARDHREVMDAAVSATLGKSSPDGPRLLIGTQTLEQSLDIDADLLITDLCPMDVLLQRIGRLHRHRRDRRPAKYASPKVLVRSPAAGDLRPWLGADGALRAPAGLGRVYVDGRTLQCTLDLLRSDPEFVIPTDNRRLVEGATHPDAWQTLPSEWRSHGDCVDGAEMLKVRAALTSAIESLPFGEFHYPAPDERVSTRLGAANLDLRLAHPLSEPFGTLVHTIGIPAHMAPRTSSLPDVVEAEVIDGGFRFELGTKRYRYTRYGLEFDDA